MISGELAFPEKEKVVPGWSEAVALFLDGLSELGLQVVGAAVGRPFSLGPCLHTSGGAETAAIYVLLKHSLTEDGDDCDAQGWTWKQVAQTVGRGQTIEPKPIDCLS